MKTSTVSSDRYWIKKDGEWSEVTAEKFIEEEQNAGFMPKPGCGPFATGGFVGGQDVTGRITREEITAVDYGWDPEFLALAQALKKE